MPHKLIDCEDLTKCPCFQDSSAKSLRLPHESWLPVLQHACDFGPQIFENVSLNLLKNPNVNSSLLFRADILYDSANNKLTDEVLPEADRLEALRSHCLRDGELPGFEIRRTILRRMIPRNPQLDKPILQTCVFLKSIHSTERLEQNLVIYIPHSSSVDGLPWYHPQVHSLAYLHTWSQNPVSDSSGSVSLHYRLYSPEALPLSSRLYRTGQHLLSTLHRHGQGRLNGYTKRVHHDQIILQQRVQDTYSELKGRHAKRLLDRWVEETEPSKHVFEDLGIAAFLIELWRDMYSHVRPLGDDGFPGFVDIGCGNGVLVDVLVREGYRGWGFDARKRKTWDTFEPSIRTHLKQMILIPEPLVQGSTGMNPFSTKATSVLSKARSLSATLSPTKTKTPTSHNGIFPAATFIISNHADELTPWTPLLAALSSSPFLCIPCCSHNLSGQRFRAPSVFNNNSADTLAPSYFANQISKAKSIPLAVATSDDAEVFGGCKQNPEQGDLKDLSAKSRSKQPSAYSSLCDWVAHLSARVGYEVEREMLRLPSTRNLGIVGRSFRDGFELLPLEDRKKMVDEIVREEKADGGAWVERAKGLIGGGGGH